MNNAGEMQFTRGIVQLDNFGDYIVPILGFPFYDSLDILYDMRNRFDSKSSKHPPTEALNDFLRFFVPTLAHPFVKNYDNWLGKLPLSNVNHYDMSAIGIPIAASQPLHEPISDSLLKQIVKFWIEIAIEQNCWFFSAEELQRQPVIDAINNAKKSVDSANVVWQFERLRTLWQKRQELAIGYRALQSLLSVQFVRSSQDHPLFIDGTAIEWRAAQEDNYLIPVSQALTNKDGASYAYTIDFQLRDMPGRNEPLVYIIPHHRRYMTQPIRWLNYQSARVMVEYPTPLPKQAAPQINVQIPIKVSYIKRIKEYQYNSYLVPMLQRVIGVTELSKALVDVKKLMKHPDTYLNARPEWNNARYHVLFNPEMKPEHAMNPGVDDGRLQQLYAAVLTNLAGWICPENALPFIPEFTISETDISEHDYLPLMNLPMVKDKVWIGKKSIAQKRQHWQTHIQDRFRIALNKKPLVILLIADNDNALEAMEQSVRGVLGITAMTARLPAGFEIVRTHTASEFILLIPKVNKSEFQNDVRQIQRAISQLKDVNGNAIQFDNNKAYAALIQRPAEPMDEDKEKDDAKKSALRCAFGSKTIRTQMKRRFPDEGKRGLQNRHANPQQKERSRLIMAGSDMLISGTGMSYDAPAKIYTDILGFDKSLAETIIVEYWIRHRVQYPKTDFIAIARQYADTGYIEILFPDKAGKPLKALSVHDAAIYLQRLFANGRKEDRVYSKYDDVPVDAVLDFFQSQLTPRTQPTLIVPQVGDWRSRDTKWFSDDVFQPNVVNIGNRAYSANTLTNVRIVKMLTDDRYNMRYWQPGGSDYKGLIGIPDTFNRIPTLYSIDNDELYEHEGSDIEDRYSRGQVIEFVATLMQDSDDKTRQLAWCAIPHLARIHPGWSRATTYPYPYHIVKNMIKDALWTVFEK